MIGANDVHVPTHFYTTILCINLGADGLDNYYSQVVAPNTKIEHVWKQDYDVESFDTVQKQTGFTLDLGGTPITFKKLKSLREISKASLKILAALRLKIFSPSIRADLLRPSHFSF